MKTQQEMGPCLGILLAVFNVAGNRHADQIQRTDQGLHMLMHCSSEIRNRAEDQYGLLTCSRLALTLR